MATEPPNPPPAHEPTGTTSTPPAREIRGRTLLLVGSVTALLTWSGFLLLTRFVPPVSISAIVVALVLLALALTSTLALVVYFVRTRFPGARPARSAANHALREAALLSICAIFNLLLRLLHSWSIFTLLISVAILVVIEILVLGLGGEQRPY